MKAGEGVKVTLQVFLIAVQVRGRLHVPPFYTRNVVALCEPIRPGGENYLAVTDRGDVLTNIVSHVTSRFESQSLR
jgi:hypothetical protein